MDNINLIEKAKSGNISALIALLSANYPILQGYVIKMTGNIDIAQDIVQETMLKAVIHIKKFIPNAKFSTWLITIATNLYRDLLRKTKNLELISETIETNEISPINILKIIKKGELIKQNRKNSLEFIFLYHCHL
ncbi:sigma-70 family RNA polymerase sigma factor [Clostridium estertheticum]|uniref:sigma-70 family RNA polymerase sigma factor n=1 Tax=Clostridium estertheticum TaxID=238834 RepID=UPI001CF55F36|nr:sigma-70 family RNA polymerase sigma factor [Clostridium estertheticum]MCB2358991.1 sigma-70 family RNA polymerase sigma factor [Clostridium estertheticum]